MAGLISGSGVSGKKEINTLQGADGVRAIACLLVIFHHMAQRLDITSKPDIVQDIFYFLLTGNSGVGFFFVLSGFLLSYPFWKEYLNNGRYPDLRNFAVRRAARIMPGYYAALITAMLLSLVVVPNSYLFNVTVPKMEYFWPKLITGLTFTSGFNYKTFFPSIIDSPLWSISFEVFCYFLMPVFMAGLFFLTGKKRSFVKAIIFWIGVEIFIIFANGLIHKFFTPDNIRRGWEYGMTGGTKWWIPHYNPVGFFAQFTVGIMAAGVSLRLSRPSEKKENFYKKNGFDIVSILLLISIAALLWCMKYEREFSISLQQQPYYFPYLTILIAGLLVTLSHSRRMGKILDNGFFRYTAKISFGLYIWHYLIMYIVSFLWYNDYSYTFYVRDWRVWFQASAIFLVLSYIAATMSFYFLEKPFLDRVHNRTAVKPVKVRSRIRLRHVVTALILSVFAVVCLYPLVWLFDASLRPSLEAMQAPPVIFQKPIWEAVKTYTRDAYLSCFLYYQIGQGLINSLVITISTVVLTLLICSLCAYAFTFIKFPGKNFFFILSVGSMMLPIQTMIVSIYKVMRVLNLINNWMGLILIGSVSGLGIFLLRQYFIKIPVSYIESAKMDGASHFQTWWHVILPLAKPVLATLAIIQFRYAWNDFLLPIVLLRDEKLFTMPLRIMTMGGSIFGSASTLLAAGFILIAVPLAFFIKFQRQFIESLTAGLKS